MAHKSQRELRSYIQKLQKNDGAFRVSETFSGNKADRTNRHNLITARFCQSKNRHSTGDDFKVMAAAWNEFISEADAWNWNKRERYDYGKIIMK